MGLSFSSNARVPIYSVADAAALAAKTGMIEGDLAYQEDTKVWYSYDGATWNVVVAAYGAPYFIPQLVNAATIGQGTWAISDQPLQFQSQFITNTSNADGDNLTTPSFTCDAGSYKIGVVHLKSNGSAKVDVFVDSTKVLSADDWYAAAASWNLVTQTSAISLTAGTHTIKIAANGKNAASAGYGVNHNGFILLKQ